MTRLQGKLSSVYIWIGTDLYIDKKINKKTSTKYEVNCNFVIAGSVHVSPLSTFSKYISCILTSFLISGSLQTLSMMSGVGMILQLGATAQIIVRALITIG